MPKNVEKQLLKQHSGAYYVTVRLFPKRVRRDLFRLYNFIKLTDPVTQESAETPAEVTKLEREYRQALQTDHYDPTTHNWDDPDTRVVKTMMRLTQRYKLDPDWLKSLLEARKTKPKRFDKLDAALNYVRSTSEVIGLIAANILRLPEDIWENARLQARAMQWLNFLRDLSKDTAEGKQYFPAEDLKAAGLKDLKEETVREHPEEFKKFIGIELKRYRDWQSEAEKGYKSVPKRLRIPLEAFAKRYKRVANKIEKDPYSIFPKR